VNFDKQILNLFSEYSNAAFNELALDIFRYQAKDNPVYKQYLELINCELSSIVSYHDIPLLPISLFKSYVIKTGNWEEEMVFQSSGTTSSIRSKNYLKSVNWYNAITKKILAYSGFSLDDTVVLGLLPHYIENGESSLVQMVHNFQELSHTPAPRNFLYEFDELDSLLSNILEGTDKKILLFGVTYALLDFACQYPRSSDRLSVIFTGGMKGRREELGHGDIVATLRRDFALSPIYSEYGMTEMLSQAYSIKEDRFIMPPTMAVSVKQLQDPYSEVRRSKTGVIGIIDLANYHTVSFILTEDLGVHYDDDTLEIVGRMELSDIRGCNLLYQPD